MRKANWMALLTIGFIVPSLSGAEDVVSDDTERQPWLQESLLPTAPDDTFYRHISSLSSQHSVRLRARVHVDFLDNSVYGRVTRARSFVAVNTG